jgi:hypothetical protein
MGENQIMCFIYVNWRDELPQGNCTMSDDFNIAWVFCLNVLTFGKGQRPMPRDINTGGFVDNE